MHIQQKHFPNTQTPQKKFLHNIKKQHTNKPRNVKHLLNHKAHYLPNATNSISATKNTAPATHHNTKLYIIYIMRLLCAALCTCTPTIKNTCNARKQSTHTPPLFFITHHKVRPSPNPTQKQTAHPRAHNNKKNHHTLQQLRPRRPAQTIHNTHKKKHKKRNKKNRDARPVFY